MSLQIARVLASAILRGELRPGEALPGTRDLASSLGASRYAVLGALRELELEGFLEVKQASGSRVAGRLPGLLPRAWGGQPPPPAPVPEAPAFALSSQLAPISALGTADFDLAGAGPDPRLAPQKALARAYQRALDRHGDELLAPGEPKGNLLLRQALVDFLREHRGLRLEPEQMLLTRGTGAAMPLVLGLLFRRGGALAVEAPTAPFLREAVTRPGVELLPVPVDDEGFAPAALEEEMARRPAAALLVQPVAQVPTGRSLAPGRRGALLDLAFRNRLALLEEDSGFAAFEGGAAPLPLAAEDRHGSVIYLLSFDRLLAPGLRIGLVAGPRSFIDRLARLRRESHQQGDRVLEWAVGDLLRDGDLERSLRRNARVHAERTLECRRALESAFGEAFGIGGATTTGLWLRPRPGFPFTAWLGACAARGVRLGTLGEAGAWMGTASLDGARLPDLLARLEEARKGLGS